MSTIYEIRGKNKVSFKRLRNDIGQGKLPGLSLDKESQEKIRGCVTDGTYFLHCYDLREPNASFERCGQNDVSNILNKIAKHYNIRIVSEYGDDEFPCEESKVEQKQEVTATIHPNQPRKMEK